MGELKSPDKPFEISKWEVWEAWEKVKANKGAPGVDGVSIEEFEADLKNNLYKVWNRMSSGTLFPPPVRAVEIPKPHGGAPGCSGCPPSLTGSRKRWWPRSWRRGSRRSSTPDSYGYRPGRLGVGRGGGVPAALLEDRLGDRFGHPEVLRQRSVGSDAQGGGGQHRSAVGGAVCARWLHAPVQLPDGTLQQRDRGTPQGSAVSPVLANLFLHYAFDTWMAREFPTVRFERYVDDAVVHCVSERQARQVLAALQDRMAEVGLQLHPDKTRIVYCQDGKRRDAFEHTSFTFLGYTFRPRGARAKDGSMFVSFAPAISKDALKKIGQEVRSWRLHRRTGAILLRTRTVGQSHCAGLDAVLRRVLPVGAVSPPDAHQRLPDALGPQEISPVPGTPRVPAGVAAGRYASTRGSSPTGSGQPPSRPSGDQGDKSRMNREVHVRICGSRRVRLPPATRPADQASPTACGCITGSR